MTRSISELLQVVLDNHEKLDRVLSRGICLWVLHLEYLYLITNEESLMLGVYIDKHLPERRRDGYCWHKEDLESRLNWLKEHIELSKK